MVQIAINFSGNATEKAKETKSAFDGVAESTEKITKTLLDVNSKLTGLASAAENAQRAIDGMSNSAANVNVKPIVDAKKAIQETTAATEKATASIAAMGTSIDASWSKLNSRSTASIASEMRGVVDAFRAIKTDGASSAQDISRAYDTMRERLRGLSTEARGASKEISNVTKSNMDVGAAAANAGVRLRTLATEILALVGAYKALQAASSFVSRTFDFSSNLEDSQIAIASVLGATNKIADSQGRILEGAEKFNAAQEISAQMMEKIQVLALQTTANFDDIVQGVSGIIAPATKAGVAMEKLPQFAVTAAQAMTAMKIPVQQMRTEIEALLSGNINKAQDILATNLGITGEMVRNWQEQGTLVDELTKRLAVFAEASEATAQTWSGLKSNMEDALDYLSTQTGKGLFEGAKQSYRELLALLVSTDQNKLGLNEDVKNLVEMMRELEDEIGNKLVEATKDFVEIIKELNKPENTEELKQSLKSIGSLLSDVGSAISSISGMAFGVVRDLNSEFQSLPEDLRTFGLIGLMLFGRTGPAKMLAAVAAAYVEAPKVGASIAAQIAGIFGQDVAVSSDGSAASKQYWANRQKAPQLARSGTSMDFVGPPKPDQQYTLTNAIGGFDNKKSGGADKIANAREQIQKLREEIDALNGEATKKSNGLDQKEREIEKLGKSAGLSAAEVAQLQDDYAEAFKTNTLKEFNKHLMEVEGNTKALRDIKIDEEMTKWQSSFNELVSRGKMSSEEATESLTRMKTALVNQSEVKDLQTAVQFYKELGELSGQYGAGIEFQNRLLKEQARAHITRAYLTSLLPKWSSSNSCRIPLTALTAHTVGW